MFQFVGGAVILVVGIWFLSYNIRETRKGYRSQYGNDIKLYFSSIIAILLGLAMIIHSLNV